MSEWEDKRRASYGDNGVKSDLTTALAGENGNVMVVEERSTSSGAITSSQIVVTGPGALKGLFVTAASNTPTIKLWNGTSATGPVLVDTFTPTAATSYAFPGVEFGIGLYITIGGTVSCCVFTKEIEA